MAKNLRNFGWNFCTPLKSLYWRARIDRFKYLHHAMVLIMMFCANPVFGMNSTELTGSSTGTTFPSDKTAATVNDDLSPSLPLIRDRQETGHPFGFEWSNGVLILAMLGGLAFLFMKGMRLNKQGIHQAESRHFFKGVPWLRLSKNRPPLILIANLRLTARSSLHVVEWQGKQWLIGAGEHGLTCLGSQPADCEQAPLPRVDPCEDQAGESTVAADVKN